jgi:hypothetical protein
MEFVRNVDIIITHKQTKEVNKMTNKEIAEGIGKLAELFCNKRESYVKCYGTGDGFENWFNNYLKDQGINLKKTN